MAFDNGAAIVPSRRLHNVSAAVERLRLHCYNRRRSTRFWYFDCPQFQAVPG